MADDFVEEYVSQCIENGIKSPKDICNAARKRIAEIETELVRADVLRIERQNLAQVLKDFGFDKQRKQNQDVELNGNINPEYEEVISKIVDFIDKTDKSVTAREVMNEVGSLEENSIIYMAIKWLCDNKILNRLEDRSLVKGDNWQEGSKLQKVS